MFAGLERTLGGGWLAAIGGSAIAWREPGVASANAAGGMLRLTRSDRSANRSVLGEVEVTPTMARAALDASPAFGLGPLDVQPIVRMGWGRRLPLQYQFQLGGTEGFPGLHIGELRGNREAMAGLAVTIPLKGAVVFVAEGAVGRSASGGPLLIRMAGLLVQGRESGPTRRSARCVSTTGSRPADGRRFASGWAAGSSRRDLEQAAERRGVVG